MNNTTALGQDLDRVQKKKKASKNGARYSRFIFTLNNYTPAEEKDIQASCKAKNISWLIYGREIAPTTGTPHLQGACVVGRRLAASTIAKYPGFSRMRMSDMDGSCAANKTYCTKQDKNYFEHGTMQEQGKRNDLVEVVSTLRANHSLRALVSDDNHAATYIRYSRGIEKFLDLTAPLTRVQPIVIWLHGPTGVGKSYTARETSGRLFGEEGTWMSGVDLQWYDGYNRNKSAILDEFRPENYKFQFLLRLLDRYPVLVPVKHGHTTWCPEVIWITSPTEPANSCFPCHDPLDQLLRRISIIAKVPEETEKVYALLCTKYPRELVYPVQVDTPPHNGSDRQDREGESGVDSEDAERDGSFEWRAPPGQCSGESDSDTTDFNGAMSKQVPSMSRTIGTAPTEPSTQVVPGTPEPILIESSEDEDSVVMEGTKSLEEEDSDEDFQPSPVWNVRKFNALRKK